MIKKFVKCLVVSLVGYQGFLRLTAIFRLNQSRLRPGEIGAVGALLPNDAVVLDVGANIGYVSATFLGNTMRRVVAVEPDADNFGCLSWLLGRRSRVATVRCAVGDRLGSVRLSVPVVNGVKQHALGRIGESGDEVPLRTVDDLRAQYGAFSLVKIDVEGYECQVLRGMRDTVTRDRPILYVEVCGEESCSVFREFVRDHDYVAKTWNGIGWMPAPLVISGNYLLVPSVSA